MRIRGHPKFVLKGINVINDNDRTFTCWGSVEKKDKAGEFIPMEELLKIMPIIMDRGGVIMEQHSNRHIGKILNYEEKDKGDKPAILIRGKIFSHSKYDDMVWSKMKKWYKEGKGGMSFGGANYSSEYDIEKGKILKDVVGFEWSVVDDPCNDESTFEEMNLLAKGGEMKKDNDGRPPKEWWSKCTKSVKEDNPDYTEDQVAGTCGMLWYSGKKPSFEKSAEVNKGYTPDGKHVHTEENVTGDHNHPEIENAIESLRRDLWAIRDKLPKEQPQEVLRGNIQNPDNTGKSVAGSAEVKKEGIMPEDTKKNLGYVTKEEFSSLEKTMTSMNEMLKSFIEKQEEKKEDKAEEKKEEKKDKEEEKVEENKKEAPGLPEGKKDEALSSGEKKILPKSEADAPEQKPETDTVTIMEKMITKAVAEEIQKSKLTASTPRPFAKSSAGYRDIKKGGKNLALQVAMGEVNLDWEDIQKAQVEKLREEKASILASN